MKRKVSFLDAGRSRVTVEVEIKDGRFSMSGEVGGSMGQVLDSIEPDGDLQNQLISLWRKYHLNDMVAGTPKQMELVSDLPMQSGIRKLLQTDRKTGEFVNGHIYLNRLTVYTDRLSDLVKWSETKTEEELAEKIYFDEEGNELATPTTYFEQERVKLEGKIKKYTELIRSTMLFDELPDGTLHKYGTGWLTVDLPEDIEDLVDELFTDIEEEEENKKDTKVEDFDIEDIEEELGEVDTDVERVYAIATMFDLTLSELSDIDIDGTRVCVQGIDYLFGTDNEMDDEWEESLDNYLSECVYPDLKGSLSNYFDEDAWKSDAKLDGRAHSLNHYDGGEESIEVGGTWYYAYRQ